jgi:hypothetical protein
LCGLCAPVVHWLGGGVALADRYGGLGGGHVCLSGLGVGVGRMVLREHGLGHRHGGTLHHDLRLRCAVLL